MRRCLGLLAYTAFLGLVAVVPTRAQADLIGVGGTVQVFYDGGSFIFPVGLDADGLSSDPAPLTGPVSFSNTVALTDIVVGNTQIVLTNTVADSFCVAGLSGTACADAVDGFDFVFTGEDIQGVSVDAASSPAFLPVSGTFQGNTHLGLQLLSPDEIRLDLTGDDPAVNDQLILDLSFQALSPPTTAPEPMSLALFGSALAGLVAMRRRRRSRA